MDLGMSPIPGIPQDPHTIGDVLEMVDIILECLREAYASGHGPWDLALLTCRHHLRCPAYTSILFCFHFISCCKILQGLDAFYVFVPPVFLSPSLARQGLGLSVVSILTDKPPPRSLTAASRGSRAQLVT
jgi:hypothetical protein